MFSFSPEFYKAALNVLIKNELFSEHIHKINEDFFSEDIEAIEHFRNIKKMIKDYGYVNEKIYKEEYGKKAEKLLSFNYKSTEEYVKANIKKFVFVTGIKSFMDEMADILKEDFRDIKENSIDNKLLSLERSRIQEKRKRGIHYFDNVSRRIIETTSVRGIPTGWYNIDKRLFGGGLCPGELGIILALPNRGKSATLVNLSVIAATFGRNVLYVTLEMSEDMIAHRMDMRLTGFTSEEVETNVSDVVKRLERFREITKGNIYIQGFQSSNATVYDIRDLILDLKKSGDFDVDFLVVDYADILTTRNKSKRDDLDSKSIYEDLRKLGNEFNMPVWTASQSNRSGFDTQVLDMRKFADAFSKGFVGDVIISINQDDKQKEEGKAYYYIAKNRNECAGFGELLSVDWKRMVVSDANDYDIFYNKKY